MKLVSPDHVAWSQGPRSKENVRSCRRWEEPLRQEDRGCPGVTTVGAEAFPLGQGREGQVQ